MKYLIAIPILLYVSFLYAFEVSILSDRNNNTVSNVVIQCNGKTYIKSVLNEELEDETDNIYNWAKEKCEERK